MRTLKLKYDIPTYYAYFQNISKLIDLTSVKNAIENGNFDTEHA
jgi:hypothetical protein